MSSIEKIYCLINVDHCVDCFVVLYNFCCLQVIDRTSTHWYFDNSRSHLDCCNDTYLYQHIHLGKYLNNRCVEFLVQQQLIRLTSLSSSIATVIVRIAVLISTSLPILRILLRRHNDKFVLNRQDDVVLCANCKMSVENK